MKICKFDRPECAGFTYFGILITIALIGTSLSAVGTVWSIQNRRADEAELIYVGQSFRRAIASYFKATPTGVNQYPLSLSDLLSDRRGGKNVRHLRRIYRDPLSGEADWELMKLADGSIFGLASRSLEQPFKRSNFDAWEVAFENASCYCDWQFVFLPQLVSNSTVTP